VSVRSALLRGRDCERIGAIDTVAEGPAGIALSRGGAGKVYDYTDPNEDCCLFALGEGGVLIAVADGHHGEFGSRTQLEAIEQDLALAACAAVPPATDSEGWCDWLYAGVRDATAAIRRYSGDHHVEIAPTTLALAIVRPVDAHWGWCCVGDSHVFRVDASAAHDLGPRGRASGHQYFLGKPEESWHREATSLGFEPLGDTRSIVLASDGLSEKDIGLDDPAAAVLETVNAAEAYPSGVRSQRLVRALAERANASHRARRSGDNIAVAAVGP